MKTLTTLTMIFAMTVCLTPARGSERALADGLSAAGAATAAKGNTAQAKDIFFKALAHDDSCPEALFELGKIIEKEGDVATAGDLYQRAALQFAQEAKPANATKRAEAEKRAKALNPLAAKLNTVYEDYSQDLDKIVKKLPDSLTEVSALERVNELELPGVLPPDKLPKFYASAQAAMEKKARANDTAMLDTPGAPGMAKRKRKGLAAKAEGASDADVETELKALGWNTVSGTWVKKSAGVYETTGGRLEALKLNGMIDFSVIKGGGEGTVRASVRTEPKGGGTELGSAPESEMLGVGTYFRGKDFRNFGYGERVRAKRALANGVAASGPMSIGLFPINEALPKQHFTVKIEDVQLECYYNNNLSSRSTNTRLPHTGTFVLDVNGTVTIEAPRCAGH